MPPFFKTLWLCFLLTPGLVHAQGLSAAEQASLLERSRLVDCKWKEMALTCSPGEVSALNLQRALLRINLFRTMVGLDTLILSSELNERAQLAAFMCHVNKRLEHHPSPDWRCYSATADSALAQSNLRFYDEKDRNSKREMEPVNGFIEDHGAANSALGHRRWLLYSQLQRVGYGATETTEAIAVVFPTADDYHRPKTERIAYPPPGDVLEQLVFPKWSLGLPEYAVDFSRAVVTMTLDGGKLIRMRKLRPVEAYGDPTLVWEPQGIFRGKPGSSTIRPEFLNKAIAVKVDGVVVNGEKKSYEYLVRIVSLQP